MADNQARETAIIPFGEVLALVLHGSSAHTLRYGPQHLLHHGQMLQVLMRLEQSIACKDCPSLAQDRRVMLFSS